MNINKYNTRVRQAISDEYVKCSKRKQEIFQRINDIESELKDKGESLTRKEYKDLVKERYSLLELYKLEDVKLDVWDKAREICLNNADDC